MKPFGSGKPSLYGACCVKLYVIVAFPCWRRDDLRGARDRALSSRRNLVFGRSARDLDHDARMRIGSEAPRRRTHFRGGGPILTRGSKAIAWVGIPPPRTVLGSLP